MFLFRKNIILVPTDYDGISKVKGLLSFDAYTGKTICNLHCYNLDMENSLLLGVLIKNKLYKIKIEPQQLNGINFDLDTEIKNNEKLSAVLLDVDKNDYNIVLWGSTEINNNWQNELKIMIENESEIISQNQNSEKNTQNVAENVYKYYQNEDIEEQNQNTNKQKINQSFIQKNDYESSKNESDNFGITGDVVLEEYIDKVIDLAEQEEIDYDKNEDFDENNDKMPSFYQKISPQIDKLFADNQDETILSEIIPNSKFCKVEFDDGTGYYVFGIIYENGLPKYLCYGLPAKKDSKPPQQLANFYQWLPIDTTNDQDDGFYMMYQDAETGQNISVEII